MRDIHTHTHTCIYLPFLLIKKRTIGPVARRKKQNPSSPPASRGSALIRPTNGSRWCIKHTTGGSNADLIMQDRCFAPLDWTDRTRSGCFSTRVDSCIIREMGREKGEGVEEEEKEEEEEERSGWTSCYRFFERKRSPATWKEMATSIFQKVFQQQLACRRVSLSLSLLILSTNATKAQPLPSFDPFASWDMLWRSMIETPFCLALLFFFIITGNNCFTAWNIACLDYTINRHDWW